MSTSPGVSTSNAIAAAQSGDDPVATETLRAFIRIFGTVTGNLALIHLPFGGVYLIGGMARAVTPWFDTMGYADAIRDKGKGLRVIIADGECMLARQRREKPQTAKALARGERVVRTRYGVDEDTCTGDHSCIRLSACPTLTGKQPSDPLRTSPVAHVTNGCVGCGNCGEIAHAAILCPSFYRTDIVQNPNWFDRTLARMRTAVISVLASKREART